MILRKILLEDFGLYAGVCEIDLTPRKSGGLTRPIVLIGGKNGSGKTTLLEGVRLALYGRRALGTRVGQPEYDDYLKRRVHIASSTQRASVGLEFDYAEAGVVHRYQVRREWAVRGKSVVETLSLTKDDSAVSTVPPDEWQQFLQELIPPGVSQLFFFDGEKIREIADAEDNNEQLAQAIRGLLGIDLIERARTDLGLYLGRAQRSETSDEGSRLEVVVLEIERQDERLRELSDAIGELITMRAGQASSAESVRRRFVQEGGDAAAQRSKLEFERDELRRRVHACNSQLRDLANGLLPFALAPKLLDRFRNSLSADHSRLNQTASVELLLSEIDLWRDSGNPKRQAKWDSKHWSDVKFFLKGSLKKVAKSDSSSAFAGLDTADTIAKLIEIDRVIRPGAIALCAELDELTTRTAEIESSLARADNAAAGILLDELRLADQAVGATEAALQAQEGELKKVMSQKTVLERERKRLLEDQANTATSQYRVELAGRAAQALATFERRLLERKLSQLRVEFVRHFNVLARKNDLIADIVVDPESFAATLIDKQGRVIPKISLSAGEQQVYAIAMLWALAKTSGRPLPMIIDTPLARLDTEHRDNLLEKYFPHASHQVVLLSTDTEISESLLGQLGRQVSHAYRLDYDPVEKRTVVSTGYFDSKSNSRGKEVRRAV